MQLPYYADGWLTVYHGDSRAVMATLPAESVHCVVTSPPYWGLRDYSIDSQLGLEATPEEYVASMVAVFREVRRVLRSDGTLWLNLGDTYNSRLDGSHGGWNGSSSKPQRVKNDGADVQISAPGLKPKDLVGIPWRVAFALQADGWYLRSDIIWSKPNPMPESVTDRPTKAHEYVFLLAKSPRYYFDADAVREANATIGDRREGNGRFAYEGKYDGNQDDGTQQAFVTINPAGRNIRTVWTIPTAPYPGAHFATFPPKLVEPCIKAGTSERGVCTECGAPWQRIVERSPLDAPRERNIGGRTDGLTALSGGAVDWAKKQPDLTIGWRPSCRHDAEPVPATVLDPFAGSGTSGMVAQSLSRRAVLIDLSMDYLGQLMERNRDIPLGLGA